MGKLHEIDGKKVVIVGAIYNPKNPCMDCCFDNDSSICLMRFKQGLGILCSQYELYPELREIESNGLNTIFKKETREGNFNAE